ncbi:DUF3934 domain-containing protein [Planococcus sp. N028]|uniref:DUF3934 domain-containing protein n=1 Tax=Planococcus shixiaomingii TaxID=3058393 RepID=A0ABT8N3A0_9BACL|nr:MULTISPECIES: DUF3934 domain-containing protein [unclassified Planococcus (in: firmicutes)]MDN7242366.1 DUF3934 domain-containing protein [Planococcus sp. N028]WKA54606.1 DUF3934 domain-containing protein [Planococcus sp. N022]
MVKKKKSGVGQGTGKKGWNRWKVGANKAKSAKPYTSKANKRQEEPKGDEKNKEKTGEWVDG